MTQLGTVMIIDDEEIDQRQYKRILQRSGLVEQVLQFSYADEALAWLLENRDRKIDLIFLDINMPRMNGFDFLRRASNELPMLQAAVVVMLTTSLNPADREQAEQYPMVKGFFSKPLTMDLLSEAISFVSNAPAKEQIRVS